MDYILEKYREFSPAVTQYGRPMIWYTAESDYENLYRYELRTAHTLLVFSLLSLILFLLGILCMVSFMIEKRSKEIAIRRINGAETYHIVLLFAREFLSVGCVAAGSAAVISWVLMHGWLENYVYRISLSWWVFLLIPVLVFLLTLGIIVLQVLLLGRRQPVNSLRNE